MCLDAIVVSFAALDRLFLSVTSTSLNPRVRPLHSHIRRLTKEMEIRGSSVYLNNSSGDWQEPPSVSHLQVWRTCHEAS